MPIEIREMHIKAVVDAGGQSKTESGAIENASKTKDQNDGNSEQLVELCIEKILAILKEKKER